MKEEAKLDQGEIPLLSLILPAHQAETDLSLTLQSIVDQDYPNKEVWVIENGSQDQTLALAKAWAKKYEWIHVEESQDKGVARARNRGLEKAKGDWIGFCDAGDFLFPGALSKVAQVMTDQPDKDLIAFGFTVAEKLGNRWKHEKRAYRQVKEWTGLTLGRRILFDERLMGAVWNKFFRADTLLTQRFQSELTHCEDMYFCLTYLFDRPDSRIYVSPEVIYAYVKEESSATQNNRALFHEDGRLKYVDAFVPFVEENQLDWWTMALLKRNIFKLAKRNQKRLKNLNLSPQPVQALKQRYWPYFYGNLPLLIWQLVRRFQARCQARQQIFWTHDWPREGE